MDELQEMIQLLLANPNPGAQRGQLTLMQLKDVIEVAARAAQLPGQSEYRVEVPMMFAYPWAAHPVQICPGYLDYVWKLPNAGGVVVACEIDGVNVKRPHVFGHEQPPLPERRNAVGIIRKLSVSNAPVRVHALYSCRGPGPLAASERIPIYAAQVQNWHDQQNIVAPQSVLVRTDRQLLDGGLLQIVAQAIEAAGI